MSDSSDPYNLYRFVEAQEPVIQDVKQELRSGRKQSHWMWFIFPQMEGLGRSQRSKHYGISSQNEAEAYLEHPILGPRLRECAELVNAIDDRSALEIFGSPDNKKFRSSMTLFDTIAPDPSPFSTALKQYFESQPDQKTLELLENA